MSSTAFRALVVREQDDGAFSRDIETVSIDALPPGAVTIRVTHSSLNYKDALSASGNHGVTRSYPHTPGVDAAGVVSASEHPAWNVGDAVLVMGFDFGMNTHGGFSEYIRVPAEWVMRQPDAMDARACMAYGTAGFTAALMVARVIHHGHRPEDGPVLVTGASGGVGSAAIRLLSQLGYAVSAASGRPALEPVLRDWGATDVIDSADLATDPKRPLAKRRAQACIDTVGGPLLASVVRSTGYGGLVVTCGNAGGAELNLTVYPFILRGVTLIGVGAADCPLAQREPIWQRLASDWRLVDFEQTCAECSLDELKTAIDDMLGREHCGRTIVTIGAAAP